MFSASKLTPEQVDALRRHASQGANLDALQRMLKEEFGISVTYMDTRFLILDLGIELIEEPKEKAVELAKEPAKPTPTGKVTATIDTIALPGTMVSGKVEFSDGESAVWVIDQTGRPGLDPDTPGYRPTQEDLLEFQTQLRSLMRQQGF
jgi:hypothetical protein